ncbi:MAG: hypothetical protein GDA51_06760 [Ekhidna sp.]|nr:hypothetical protein [Ekhidna sp.]MBC6426159.1 hypothetical protein [Ekhidna sp.]
MFKFIRLKIIFLTIKWSFLFISDFREGFPSLHKRLSDSLMSYNDFTRATRPALSLKDMEM